MQALADFEALLPATTKVTIASGGSGRKLAELKAWLYDQESSNTKQSPWTFGETPENGCFLYPITGSARLKGVHVKATPGEVYNIARRALAAGIGTPYNFKDWYVLVDDEKISPKWLVGQLTSLPVSRFDAGAARRVLNRLGIPVYRNEQHLTE